MFQASSCAKVDLGLEPDLDFRLSASSQAHRSDISFEDEKKCSEPETADDYLYAISQAHRSDISFEDEKKCSEPETADDYLYAISQAHRSDISFEDEKKCSEPETADDYLYAISQAHRSDISFEDEKKCSEPETADDYLYAISQANPSDISFEDEKKCSEPETADDYLYAISQANPSDISFEDEKKCSEPETADDYLYVTSQGIINRIWIGKGFEEEGDTDMSLLLQLRRKLELKLHRLEHFTDDGDLEKDLLSQSTKFALSFDRVDKTARNTYLSELQPRLQRRAFADLSGRKDRQLDSVFCSSHTSVAASKGRPYNNGEESSSLLHQKLRLEQKLQKWKQQDSEGMQVSSNHGELPNKQQLDEKRSSTTKRRHDWRFRGVANAAVKQKKDQSTQNGLTSFSLSRNHRIQTVTGVIKPIKQWHKDQMNRACVFIKSDRAPICFEMDEVIPNVESLLVDGGPSKLPLYEQRMHIVQLIQNIEDVKVESVDERQSIKSIETGQKRLIDVTFMIWSLYQLKVAIEPTASRRVVEARFEQQGNAGSNQLTMPPLHDLVSVDGPRCGLVKFMDIALKRLDLWEDRQSQLDFLRDVRGCEIFVCTNGDSQETLGITANNQSDYLQRVICRFALDKKMGTKAIVTAVLRLTPNCPRVAGSVFLESLSCPYVSMRSAAAYIQARQTHYKSPMELVAELRAFLVSSTAEDRNDSPTSLSNKSAPPTNKNRQ